MTKIESAARIRTLYHLDETSVVSHRYAAITERSEEMDGPMFLVVVHSALGIFYYGLAIKVHYRNRNRKEE